ncbi:hypothetical protein FRZ67_05100 [Panacibacter ginsenosidivorans]|uniref:Uncharacterized protein n=1 Tax=Panacibacter ginsenosidivorans TaxID=1813871 RepID=A0A5B8V5D4_9BACT|nr:hypothetical protein [Panacibacter ginsenosidivorans]QEC66707.1 hypothetical protein FRZ67_05100 [Panacibacter ginsenosidivorans]
MPGIMPRVSCIFVCLIISASCYSQNTAWLQGVWKGKSYLPGSDAAQYFSLTLRINTIKGKKFEGTLSTMEPYDTAIRYDTKINGELFEDYLTIKSTKVFYVRNSPGSQWLLSCINCKPPKMIFSLQNDKFSFKGSTEECYEQCKGTSEFVKDIKEMSAAIQDSLYALMHMEKPKDIAAASTKKDTVAKAQDEALASAVKIKDTAVAVQKENPPMPRTILAPPGDIAQVKDDKPLLASQNLLASLRRTKPSLIIRKSEALEVQQKILPVTDTLALVAKQNTTAATLKNTPLLKDSVALLPVGYTERKVNVIRTIPVDKDSITIRVYDNGVVDGDIVSVVYNDKIVIDKLSLTSKAVTLKIPVNTDGTNTLVFYAHNLGEFPPNTAKLEIIYGAKEEDLTISSDYTVSSSVNIVYRK